MANSSLIDVIPSPFGWIDKKTGQLVQPADLTMQVSPYPYHFFPANLENQVESGQSSKDLCSTQCHCQGPLRYPSSTLKRDDGPVLMYGNSTSGYSLTHQVKLQEAPPKKQRKRKAKQDSTPPTKKVKGVHSSLDITYDPFVAALAPFEQQHSDGVFESTIEQATDSDLNASDKENGTFSKTSPFPEDLIALEQAYLPADEVDTSLPEMSLYDDQAFEKLFAGCGSQS